MSICAEPRLLFLEEFEKVSDPFQSWDDPLFGQKVAVEIVAEPGPLLDFDLEENEVYLCSLRVMEKRAGHGRQAMSIIANLADEFGVNMYLDAVPQDRGPEDISARDLKKFYGAFGFYVTGEADIMFRPPDGPV